MVRPRRRDDRVLSALAGRRPNGAGWVRVDCPFCADRLGKDDTKACLGYQVSSRKWHCFRCGTAGMLAEEPDEFSSYAADLAPDDGTVPVFDPPEGFWSLSEGPGASAWSLEGARLYLARRGISPQLIAEAKIGAVAKGYLANRIVIPVLAPDNTTWLGYVARVWEDGPERKYLTAKGMRRDAILYNQRCLAVETDKPALVVEGCLDTYPYWPDACALLGKASEAQMEALLAARRPVVFMLDGDAHREAWACAMRLRLDGQRAGTVRLGAGIDPDEVPTDWAWERAVASLDSLDEVA